MDVGFGCVDELAKGEVFGLDLVNAQVLHQLNVTDDAGFDELGGVDVEGEDPLEIAREDQGAQVAVSVGVEFPKVFETVVL